MKEIGEQFVMIPGIIEMGMSSADNSDMYMLLMFTGENEIKWKVIIIFCVDKETFLLYCIWVLFYFNTFHYHLFYYNYYYSSNIVEHLPSPRPPGVFFVTRPPKGGCCNPIPRFSIQNAWYPYICYQCIGVDLLSIGTKMGTIEHHMTSLLLHKVSAPSEIWMHWKCTWKLAKINFSPKIVETWDFAGFLAEYVYEMIVLIYIAGLKHISCQLFKKMDKIKIMGCHQPPPTILFDDPLIQTKSPNFTSYTSKDA